MSKHKQFIKTYKSEFSEGESVTLYKNQYRVISCNRNYTLLKDLNNSPFAIPTNKLKEFLKKSNGEAAPGTPAEPPTETDQEAQQQKVGLPTCIKNGRLQRTCKKTKKSYWVDLKSGDTYDQHDSDKAHDTINYLTSEKDAHALAKLKAVITNDYHEKDHAELNSKLEKWSKAKVSHRHLSELYRDLKEHEEHGKTAIESLFNKEREVRKNFKELQTSLKKYRFNKN